MSELDTEVAWSRNYLLNSTYVVEKGIFAKLLLPIIFVNKFSSSCEILTTEITEKLFYGEISWENFICVHGFGQISSFGKKREIVKNCKISLRKSRNARM